MKSTKVKLLQNMKVNDYGWLHRDLNIGEEFYLYTDVTYGCISINGIAVTEEWNKKPFFEIPKELVENIL